MPHGANGSREGYRQPPSWRAPYGVRRESCEVVEVKNTEQAGHWCIGEDGGMRGPSGVLASGAGDLRTLKSFPTGSSCCQYDSTSPSHRRHLALLACRDQQKKLQCLRVWVRVFPDVDRLARWTIVVVGTVAIFIAAHRCWHYSLLD